MRASVLAGNPSREVSERTWDATAGFGNSIWLEGKFAEHGVAKVVPEPEALAATYEQARRWATVEEVARRAMAEQDTTAITVPEDLTDRVRDRLGADPALSWDEAVALVAREDHGAA